MIEGRLQHEMQTFIVFDFPDSNKYTSYTVNKKKKNSITNI